MNDRSKPTPTRPAAEVAAAAELGAAARALLTPGLAAPQFAEALANQGLTADALAVLAHALPKREAVWWACQCLRAAEVATPPEAVAAAERWAASPTEANRRAAQAAAEAATLDTPAGVVALAAFLSGGSLAPPDVQAVPPPDHLTGRAVAGAVQVAAVLREPAKAEDRHRQFLEIGRAVAAGSSRWS